MNVVNFSDGIDGLAAGVCTISSITFSIIAFDLGQNAAGVLAALTAGARSGSCSTTSTRRRSSWATRGSKLLGYLLGCVIVQGSLKTNAVIALVFPLIILAVPFVDTTFVVLKRVKNRRPVYWPTLAPPPPHRTDRLQPAPHGALPVRLDGDMAGLAVALRFVPYRQPRPPARGLGGAHGRARPARAGGEPVPRLRSRDRRSSAACARSSYAATTRPRPRHQISEEVKREFETGEFEPVEH